MGFRFRRSIRILPGIRLNVGKRGASVSMGVRGAHVTLGPKGARTTLGVPGTGLSYTKLYSSTLPNEVLPPSQGQPISRRRTRMRVLLILSIVVAWVLLVLSYK